METGRGVAGFIRRFPVLLPGLVAAVVLALLVVAATANGVTIEGAVSDQHETTRLRLLGIVSSVGVFLWVAAMAVCILAVVALDPVGDGNRWRKFFGASALITLVLLVDDFLLVHEFSDEVVSVFVDFDRTREQKDVLEGMVFACYGALFLWYCFHFRQEILGSRHRRYLLVAAAMFALSLVIDLGGAEAVGIDLPDYRTDFDVESLAEEGPKFLGIAYYATFYLLMARSVLRAEQPLAMVAEEPSVSH